jgi:hypothetical protein
VPDPRVESKTLVLRRQGVHRPKLLEAGPFAADVASFRLHLATGNKAAGTVLTYTEAALWIAAAHLLRTASLQAQGRRNLTERTRRRHDGHARSAVRRGCSFGDRWPGGAVRGGLARRVCRGAAWAAACAGEACREPADGGFRSCAWR